MAALLDAADQHVVGEDVELLDLLALHVRVAGEAEDAREPGAADLAGDDLRGQRELMEEAGEVPRRAGGAPLHREQMLLQGLPAIRGTRGPDRENFIHAKVLADSRWRGRGLSGLTY